VPAGDGSLQLVADVSRANPNATPQAVTRLAAAEETFGLDLMRLQLAASPDTNVLLSPLSAHLDLSMLELGAAGPTTQQIATALQTAGLSADAQAQAWNSLSQELLAAESSGELHLANSLWVARGLHVEAGFVEAAARSFGDDTYQTNFRTAAASDAINAWIARETGGRIQRLLQPGQLAPYTEVVLANAVHFHAAWAHKLFADATVSNQPFRVAGGGTVSVPSLVDSEDRFAFTVTHGYDAVQIPYSNGRYAALLVEPTGQSMASLLAGLSPGQLQSLTAGLRNGYVSLTMPELKLASNTSLIDPLATMGMAPVFVNADFSRMLGAFGASNQAVGVVQQAVTLNVNQWGTDAAAGTVVSVIPSDAHSSTPIAFNHPYLFLIRDTKTGTLLFSSVVNNPAAG
jgi:serpin B